MNVRCRTTMRNVTIAMLAVAVAAALFPAYSAQAISIPDWIKTTASGWVNGDITDDEFAGAIGYLVSADILRLPPVVTQDTITIGFIPVEKAEDLSPKAEALRDYLVDYLGVDVDIVIPDNYESIIEGLRFGHVDAAFMDTGPGWIAVQRTGAEVMMAEVKKDGKISYEATVWVRADNQEINSIQDTLGKKVAFTSITGSSGFVRPFGTLVNQGYVTINGDDIIALQDAIEGAFSQHTFAGGYAQALNLLVAGKVDAAFGSDIAPQLYLEPSEQGVIRAATTLGPVPSHVFVVSDEMSTPTKKALRDAMLGLNDDDYNQILRDIYGARALLPTTTTLHIGNFGDYIDALVGLDQMILDKKNFSK